MILALVFFGRKYLWPAQHSAATGDAAVAGYTRPPIAEAPDQDDGATVAGMIDAGRMWEKAHCPNSAAGCPTFPIPFHQGGVKAITSGR